LLQGNAKLAERRLVPIMGRRNSDLHDLGDLGKCQIAPNPQDNNLAKVLIQSS
jgi:hypothetical protein